MARLGRPRLYTPEEAQVRQRAANKRWREENPDYYKEWRKRNPERSRVVARRADRKLREDVLRAYGGRCACCGTDYFPHLTLDHVNGDGAEERRRHHRPGSVLDNRPTLRRLRRQLPVLDPAFQVLCFNCNFAKHVRGECGCQGARLEVVS